MKFEFTHDEIGLIGNALSIWMDGIEIHEDSCHGCQATEENQELHQRLKALLTEIEPCLTPVEGRNGSTWYTN